MTEPVDSPKTDPLQTVLLVVAAAYFVIAFAVFVWRAVPVLEFRWEVQYGESVLLDQARRVAGEGELYPPFERAPYVIDTHPPVYPVLLALLPDGGDLPFLPGRLVSFLAGIAAALGVGLIVRRWTGDVSALLAAGTIFTIPAVAEFSVIARADALALALGVWGFFGFTAEGRRARVLGLLALFLCVYTRHSMLMFPTVASVLLLWRERRNAVPWILSLLGAGLGFFIVAAVFTGGRIYEHMIDYNVMNYEWRSVANRWLNPIDLLQVVLVASSIVALAATLRIGPRVRRYATVLGLLVLIAGEANALHIERSRVVEAQLEHQALLEALQTEVGRSGQSPRFWQLKEEWEGASVAIDALKKKIPISRLVSILALAGLGALAVLFAVRRSPTAVGRESFLSADTSAALALFAAFGVGSALLIGRAGAASNYLLEFFTALTIVTTVGLSRLPRWASICVIVGIVVVGVGYMVKLQNRDTRPQRLAEIGVAQDRLTRAVKALLERDGGPILSEASAPVVLNGERMLYQPFMYRQLVNANRWQPDELIARIRNREFTGILRVNHGIEAQGNTLWRDNAVVGFPTEVRNAINEHYRFVEHTFVVEPVTPVYSKRYVMFIPKKD